MKGHRTRVLDPERHFWNPQAELISRDELAALQLKRLKKQLKYNYKNSIYYKNRFDEVGLRPEDIRSLEDFRNVPTMTKDDQRRCQEESLERFGHPYGMLACAPLEKIVRISATSGTTGRPTLYTLTKRDVEVVRELSARKYWRMGVRPGDRILHALALSMFTGGIPSCDALQEFGACIIPVGTESGISRIFQFTDFCKPKYMRCTPSTAEYILRKCPEVLGKPASALGLKGMIVGGEVGGGVPEVRKRIKEGFNLQYLFDNIGGTHVFVGYSCPATADTSNYRGMHLVSEDYCILELLDPQTQQPLEIRDGVAGEMVYTYIDWEGTPLLRYRLGDILQLHVGACECGDPRPCFKIVGRADDMLIIKGINLYPAALKSVVTSFAPKVTGEVRILLDAPGPKVTPPLKIEVEYSAEVTEENLPLLKKQMLEKMRSLLRVTPDIRFVPPNTFQWKNQKTAMFVRLYEKKVELTDSNTGNGGDHEQLEKLASQEEIMADVEGINIKQALRDQFDRNRIYEIPFFCIGRQGGRTAVEILARAFIMEGKAVYLGQNLGRRSLGTNTMIVRVAETSEIPPGMSVMHPTGMMFMHEALMWPDYQALEISQVRRSTLVNKFTSGILMVCSSKPPEEVEYPIPFEGTVATVDAEAIFTEKLSIQPAPFGIVSLGLFVAATGDLIGLETVKKATLEYERLSPRVRALNVECIQKAYETAKVARNVKLKGKVTLDKYGAISKRKPSGDFITPEEKSAATLWRDSLPVCDSRKCVCVECIAAYSCPEGVIVWKDEAFSLDYDFCKGCGTCAKECPEDAITMQSADQVLAGWAKVKQLMVLGG